MDEDQQQTLLESYFTSLCQFGYDRAKEIVDKEKDLVSARGTISSTWTNLLNVLVQLTSLEKSYMQLWFLLPKGFFRKDTSLKGAYQVLKADLQRTEDSGSTATGSDDDSELLLSHFALQLGHFITARLDMIDFYERLYNLSTVKASPNYEELIAIISDISKKNSKNFHHPVLSSLKTSFSYECETLEQLLIAQLELQKWNYMPSLIHLNSANLKLSAWGAMVQPKETRRLSFRATFLKPYQIPALYQWLSKLKTFLVAKFSFYFHELVTKQAVQHSTNLSSKMAVDHYHRMTTFQKKLDAVSILLAFDSNEDGGNRGPPGYHHPSRTFETSKGVDTFPIVVNYPLDKPTNHMPNVLMILEKRASELSFCDRSVFLYDKKVDVTYFLTKVEPRMAMVIICNGKKSEKESYITSFLNDFANQLRCVRQFSQLKPGTKS